MVDLQYSDVIGRMLQVLPEIRSYYEKRVLELCADNLPHVIFGSIFVDYLKRLMDGLEGYDQEVVKQILRKAFALIEELSTSSDFQSRCLAEASVIESLLGEPGGLARFARYMKPETKKLAIKVAKAWGLNMGQEKGQKEKKENRDIQD